LFSFSTVASQPYSFAHHHQRALDELTRISSDLRISYWNNSPVFFFCAGETAILAFSVAAQSHGPGQSSAVKFLFQAQSLATSLLFYLLFEFSFEEILQQPDSAVNLSSQGFITWGMLYEVLV